MCLWSQLSRHLYRDIYADTQSTEKEEETTSTPSSTSTTMLTTEEQVVEDDITTPVTTSSSSTESIGQRLTVSGTERVASQTQRDSYMFGTKYS